MLSRSSSISAKRSSRHSKTCSRIWKRLLISAAMDPTQHVTCETLYIIRLDPDQKRNIQHTELGKIVYGDLDAARDLVANNIDAYVWAPCVSNPSTLLSSLALTLTYCVYLRSLFPCASVPARRLIFIHAGCMPILLPPSKCWESTPSLATPRPRVRCQTERR
jgi:hypothetical protein